MKVFIREKQKQVLKVLADQIDDFYLAGGTALELFYFNHRLSEDLDFFTQTFNINQVREVINYLQSEINETIVEIGNNFDTKGPEVIFYNIKYDKEDFLKLDFVCDVLPLINIPKKHDGIKVLSVEDIYLRKIYTISGLPVKTDDIGRIKFEGGRQVAKDLFDLYFLSNEFLCLSDFLDKFCNQSIKEGVVRWYRTFNRMDMKLDLLDIKTDEAVGWKEIDNHIKEQIEIVLEREIGL